MKYRILFLFLVLIGILLIYNLAFTLKEGLTNKEIYDYIREEQDDEAINKYLKDNFNITDQTLDLNNLIGGNRASMGELESFLEDNNIDIRDKILTDLYAPKTSLVPPICPACPISCPDKTKCPPCPPCGRCPESNFTCKKVEKESSTENEEFNSDDEFACADGNCEGVSGEDISDDEENEGNNSNTENTEDTENTQENRMDENTEEGEYNSNNNSNSNTYRNDYNSANNGRNGGGGYNGGNGGSGYNGGNGGSGYNGGNGGGGYNGGNGGSGYNGGNGGSGYNGGNGGGNYNGRNSGGGYNGGNGSSGGANGSIENYNKELEAYCLTNCKGGNLLDNCAQCEPYLNKENGKFCHDDIAGVWNEI